MVEVTVYLTNAQQELADIDRRIQELQHKREIAEVRLQTLQMVQQGGVVTRKKPETARPARTSVPARSGRAPSGSWKAVFANLIKLGLDQFSYDDVVRSARELAMDAPKASARVRVSKFKDQGYLERVSEGVYRPTPQGAEFFKG